MPGGLIGSAHQQRHLRVATLADSTLRLFTNASYAKDAEKATGVRFFARDGSRRDPISVMEEMRKAFAKLTTDAQRFQYINKAFGKTDLDTQRGIFTLLNGKSLDDMRKFEAEIKNAGGALERALPEAINNAADQASRLKNTLRESAEGFARPINDVIARAIKHLLNSKAQGGMELSGGQIAGGAAVGAVGVYALSRILPGVIGRLVGRAGGVAAGVAQGKALQAAAGVVPVYVTNWAEMNGGGAAGAAGAAAAGLAAGKLGALRNAASAAVLLAHTPLGVLAGSGAAGLAAAAGGVGLAGAAGYGVGTGIYKFGLEGNKAGEGLGELVARFLSLFGNEEAKRSVAINDALKNSRVGGEITVRVQGNPNLAVQTEVRPFNGTRMNALGQTMRGAGE